MKDFIKKTGLFLLVICVLLAGCDTGGGKGAEAVSDTAADDMEENETVTYVAEDLPLPHDNIIDETVYGNTLYYLYSEAPGDENTAGKYTVYRLDMEQEGAEPTALPVSFGENDSIADMVVDVEGRLQILIFQYESQATNARLQEAIWMRLDEAGEVTDSHTVTELFKGMENPYSFGFEADAAGNVYFASDSEVSVVNQEGQVVYRTAINGSVITLYRDREDQVYVNWFGDHGVFAAALDNASKALGVSHELDWLSVLLGAGAGTGSHIMLASDIGVYDYDMEAKSYTERFRWETLDMTADFFSIVLPMDDGRVIWIGKEYAEDGITASLIVVRPKKAGEEAQDERKTLTLGGVSGFIGGEVRKAVTDFNRSHGEYRIEIKEYGGDDGQAGLDQLNMDIASGNAPDILELPVSHSTAPYAEKGVLEDLYPYMDRDGTLAREDFQENILQAHETDGKLYEFPISYRIDLLVGAKSLLGEQKNWNLDEMTAIIDGLPTKGPFWHTSKSGVLVDCLQANGEDIITQIDDESQLNRDLFLKILEFSNRFIDNEQFVYEDVSEVQKMIEDNRIYLSTGRVDSIYSYQFDRELHGEAVTYVGYPAENGGGFMAYSSNLMAINSQCTDKEVAWQFISSMLTEEFQADLMKLPILKSALEKMIEEAMEKNYTTDENGNQQEKIKYTFSRGNYTVDTFAANEEDVQEIRKVIDGVNKIRENVDWQILQILGDEAQAYFSGSKSAEEVADVADNRIRLYLSETGN